MTSETQLVPNESLTNYTKITYILYAVSCLFGITAIVALIMNYSKRDDVKGTWLESHFNWQIKTFWYSLGGFIASGILSVIFIGIFLFIAVSVWYIYRIVKGFIAFNDKKELPDTLI